MHECYDRMADPQSVKAQFECEVAKQTWSPREVLGWNFEKRGDKTPRMQTTISAYDLDKGSASVTFLELP